jgi:hypothetical protein
MTLTTKSNLLRSAGFISLILALFQVVISFSPAWSLYFGAPPELTENPPLLIISGLIVSIIFIIFGLYGLSGSGDVKPLPFLRSGLIIVGSIYLLRGMLIVLQVLIILDLVHIDEEITPQLVLSSLVSLLIGIIYVTGTIKNWQGLKPLSINKTN